MLPYTLTFNVIIVLNSIVQPNNEKKNKRKKLYLKILQLYDPVLKTTHTLCWKFYCCM